LTPRNDTPARAERQEKTTGSLEVGKKADLLVLA
jgi:imidazolonepropionase-like amidohydrolase